MINSDYELGYTPSNLKKLMQENGLTNIQVADIIGKSVKAVERFRSDVNKANHATMEHKNWIALNNFINSSKTGRSNMKEFSFAVQGGFITERSEIADYIENILINTAYELGLRGANSSQPTFLVGNLDCFSALADENLASELTYTVDAEFVKAVTDYVAKNSGLKVDYIFEDGVVIAKNGEKNTLTVAQAQPFLNELAEISAMLTTAYRREYQKLSRAFEAELDVWECMQQTAE